MRASKLILPVLVVGCLQACAPEVAPGEINTAYYEKVQKQLQEAKPGAVITLKEGTFEFDRPLSLDGVAGVTIRGAGMDRTILSFAQQKAGGEGLRITADSVVLEGFTIRDAKGDNIKVQDARGVTLRNVKTTWTGGAKATNGGYGIYPVACTDVLVEGCEASYASDAGIYVGQSTNVVVRNCHAHHNVAGIEIENCVNSEVYQNRVDNNTGGILVFDMPDLPLVNGHSTRVFANFISDNNFRNFAPEGNIVGIVPPGTGIILLAAKKVEVFNNRLTGHKTMGAAIASFQITERTWNNPQYDPFTYEVYFHNNQFERGTAAPDTTRAFGQMITTIFGPAAQDILYDGIVQDGKTGASPLNPMTICIREDQRLRFANIDAGRGSQQVSTDRRPYDCQVQVSTDLSKVVQ